MTIIHKIDKFLLKLFAQYKKSNDITILRDELITMPIEKIKEIAYDIAFQGTQGFSPAKDDYRITAIPSKLFSGLHILSYYYVSWMLSMPEMVDKLRLNYEKEYEMAKKMNLS